METSNQSVTADQLISATVKYSNKNDASRVYDITADVRIGNGHVTNFDSGEVKKLSTSETMDVMDVMNNVASFDASGDKRLNLYIHNANGDESKLILESIYTFMADVKTNVAANPVKA